MISERVYMYCCEDLSLIENYEKAISDKNQIWRCHHRLEIQDEGKLIYSAKELQDMGLYYNRPAKELIFLTLSEHNKLHGKYVSDEIKKKRSKSMRGRICSKEHREHLSQSLKGRKMSENEKKCHENHWMQQKGKTFSEETIRKMSESHKAIVTDEMREMISKRFKGVPKSEETKLKMSISAKRIMSDENEKLKRSVSIRNSQKYQTAMNKRKGEKIFNNGVNEIRAFECPPGFVPGKMPLSEERKKNISEFMKGMKWFNNGIINVRSKECPPGFVPGRLKIKSEMKNVKYLMNVN